MHYNWILFFVVSIFSLVSYADSNNNNPIIVRTNFSGKAKTDSRAPALAVAEVPIRHCAQLTVKECIALSSQIASTGNMALANEYLNEACDRGEAMACARYGLTEGNRHGGNQAAARKAMKRACTLGVTEACEILAQN